MKSEVVRGHSTGGHHEWAYQQPAASNEYQIGCDPASDGPADRGPESPESRDGGGPERLGTR